jgi:hypothetical protein
VPLSPRIMLLKASHLGWNLNFESLPYEKLLVIPALPNDIFCIQKITNRDRLQPNPSNRSDCLVRLKPDHMKNVFVIPNDKLHTKRKNKMYVECRESLSINQYLISRRQNIRGEPKDPNGREEGGHNCFTYEKATTQQKVKLQGPWEKASEKFGIDN